MDRCTSTRLPAEHTSPWFTNTPKSAPSTADSKSASAKKMLGDLPPSSRLIFFSVSAAVRMICLPTSTLPVKAILSTSSWATSGAPAVSPKPGHDVDHALGQAALLEVAGQLEERERRLLRGLDHHRAARAEGGGELPGRHQQRVVPGNDLAGHPERLLHGHRDRVVGDVQDLAVQLGGEPAVILEARGHVGDVELGLHDRLARVQGLELGQLRQLLPDLLREAQQDAAAFLAGDVAPAALERAPGRAHRAIDVGRAGVRDARP